MHHDSIHRDLLIRGAEILRSARAAVHKQEALIARLQAQNEDTLHAKAMLDLHVQTLQVFQQTFDIIAGRRRAMDSDVEVLRHRMNRVPRQ